MADSGSKNWLIFGVSLAVVVVAALVWLRLQRNNLPEAIASGNGRIEAIEYDIATKQPGRIAKMLVAEGDMVEASQVLAQMDTAELETHLRQAEAGLRQAREDKNQALAAVSQRESDLKQIRASISQRESEIKQVRAAVSQRESELTLAITQFERARLLVAKDFIAKEEFDRESFRKQTAEAALAKEQARKQAAEAMLALEQARLQSAEAALRGARIEVAQREAAIDASVARIRKINTIIDDALLKSPIRGRVLYRLAEPGEALPAGGKVLTVLELSDVYMTIFLPTALAGRVAVGAEARIVLDAVPQYVVPAKVSFVAASAQFTPKEIETRSEREKLMFRVKVRLDPELLTKYREQVKTGLPGVAYVRLNGHARWPENLNVKLPP